MRHRRQPPAASRRPPAASRRPPAASRLVSHVVGLKETLASLARRYYGNDTEKWKAIFAANQERLDDPHSLPVGTVLDIPDAISDSAFPPRPPRGGVDAFP